MGLVYLDIFLRDRDGWVYRLYFMVCKRKFKREVEFEFLFFRYSDLFIYDCGIVYVLEFGS